MKIPRDRPALVLLSLHKAGGKLLQLVPGAKALVLNPYDAEDCRARYYRGAAESDGHYRDQPAPEPVEDFSALVIAGGQFPVIHSGDAVSQLQHRGSPAHEL